MDTELLLRSATEAIRRRDLNSARQAISEVLRDQPNNANAWFLASYLSDDPAQQVRALDRALAESPGLTQAAVRRDRVRARLAESAPPSMPPSTSSSISAANVLEKQIGVGVLALEWFVASVLGWLVVWLIFFSYWLFNLTASASTFLMLFVFIVPAVAQWFVFRDAFRAGIWALFANLLSYFVGWILFLGASGLLFIMASSLDDTQPYILAFAEAGAIGGGVIALFQLPYLAAWVYRAWLWLILNGIATGLQFFVAFLTIAFLGKNFSSMGIRAGLVSGAVLGILVYSGSSTVFFALLLGWRKPRTFIQALHGSPFQARANTWGCLTFIGLIVMFVMLRTASTSVCLGTLIVTIIFCLVGLHYRRLAYREAAAAVSNTSQPVL